MDEDVEHGSRFAKSLGFFEDTAWSFTKDENAALARSSLSDKKLVRFLINIFLGI